MPQLLRHPVVDLITDEHKLFEVYEHLIGDLATKDHRRAAFIAQCLENQEKLALLEEADANTGNLPITVFPSTFAGPIIDQVYRDLVAFDLVQVQTMQYPRQSILFRDYVYSSSGGNLSWAGSYGSTAEGGTFPKGRAKLRFIDMEVKKWGFMAEYSSELFRDARAYGINIDRDVMLALSDEIRGEIDWLILNDLYTAAAGVDSAGNVDWDSAGFISASYGQNVREYEKTLYNAIVDAKNKIFKKSLRTANFLVCGPDAAARLEKLHEFSVTPEFTNTVGSIGTAFMGTLNAQYAVYRTTAVPTDKILVGCRQEGYIYAVYVPLALSERQYKVETDEWVQNVTTRFARKVVRPEFLATVTIL